MPRRSLGAGTYKGCSKFLALFTVANLVRLIRVSIKELVHCEDKKTR
jgi:hypothetical protein